MGIYDFPDIGMIATMGLLDNINTSSSCNMQAIVGGTGRYIGAKGTIDICIENDNNKNYYTHHIKMKEDSNALKPIGSYAILEQPNIDNNIHIFNTYPGIVSIGDTVPFINKLYTHSSSTGRIANEKRIGNLNGICNYISILGNVTSWYCDMIYELNNGHIMVIGIITDQHKCNKLSIIGGTLEFNIVDGGYVTICWPDSYYNYDYNTSTAMVSYDNYYDEDIYQHTLHFDDSVPSAGSAAPTDDSNSSTSSTCNDYILTMIIIAVGAFTCMVF